MDRALQIHVDTEEKYARSMHEEEKEKRKQKNNRVQTQNPKTPKPQKLRKNC